MGVSSAMDLTTPPISTAIFMGVGMCRSPRRAFDSLLAASARRLVTLSRIHSLQSDRMFEKVGNKCLSILFILSFLFHLIRHLQRILVDGMGTKTFLFR
jgi:hypothetical protein